jgi:hypothetical protein
VVHLFEVAASITPLIHRGRHVLALIHWIAAYARLADTWRQWDTSLPLFVIATRPKGRRNTLKLLAEPSFPIERSAPPHLRTGMIVSRAVPAPLGIRHGALENLAGQRYNPV